MSRTKTSRKGVKNYTTTISAEKTINEIELLLTKYGARKILLTFMVKYDTGYIPIRLPSNPEKVVLILNKKADAGNIPRKFKNDLEQASRIMWRVILDWVDSQMTMIEIGQRTLLEIFFADICPVGAKKNFFEISMEEKVKPHFLIKDNS